MKKGPLTKRILDRLLGLDMPDVVHSMMKVQPTKELVPADPVPLAWPRYLITAIVAKALPFSYTLALMEVCCLLASFLHRF